MPPELRTAIPLLSIEQTHAFSVLGIFGTTLLKSSSAFFGHITAFRKSRLWFPLIFILFNFIFRKFGLAILAFHVFSRVLTNVIHFSHKVSNMENYNHAYSRSRQKTRSFLSRHLAWAVSKLSYLHTDRRGFSAVTKQSLILEEANPLARQLTHY